MVSGRETLISCTTDQFAAGNIWVVPPGPSWFQDAMCIHVRANPDSSEFCSLRRLIYLAAVDLAQIAPAPLRFQSMRHLTLGSRMGEPPLLQPRSVTSQNQASVWQFLHHWFRPVDALPPAALALRPAAMAFFRLRSATYPVSRQEEADFWQELGQQFNVPHPQIALYRCDADESEQARPRLTPLRQMVKVSLGPAPVRVGCIDDSGYLWAWRWEDALDFEHGDFSDDAGPWSGCDETSPELAEEHMHELQEFYDYDGIGLGDCG
jgi:hypothetical protein